MMFDLIAADPPWNWKARSPKGEGRSAKRHYPVMKTQDILNLPVGDLANKNSVLLLWAIDPMLDVAFECLKKWGFTYKTVGYYWVKLYQKSPGYFMGNGYYTRANPEPCLLATRGQGLRRMDKSVRKLIVSPIGEHSEKPEEFFPRTERLFGDVSRIELFARKGRPGWVNWGMEAPLGLWDWRDT